MIVQVSVFCFDGLQKIIDLCHHEQLQTVTVLQLKEKINESFQLDSNSWGKVRLFYKDKHLDEDSKRLCEYGVEHLSVIRMLIRVTAGGSAQWLRDYRMGDKKGETRKTSLCSGIPQGSILEPLLFFTIFLWGLI